MRGPSVQAIRTLNDERYVFVVENGRARKVPVTVHESFREMRRIAGDLKPGEKIVYKGLHYIGDGDAVTVVGEERS